MKSTVENLTPTRVKLTVEVGFDELKPQLDAAYKKIGGAVRVPGFRPGKVPARIIDQRVGRGAVLEETINAAVPTFYGQAVEENSLAVLGQPEIEVTEIEDGQQLGFTAEVDVRPEFDLPDVSTLSVTVDDVVADEADVDEQINGVRDRFATLTTVERAAETGDYVSIDLAATVDGEDVPGGTTSGLSYEVGTDSLVPGIDDVLVGMSAGDATTFTSKLVAGELAGQDADIAVTVQQVKSKELPDLDDDFASMASGFESLEELRADVRTRLERVKRLEQGMSARDKVLEALIAAVDVELPEKVVESEITWRRESLDAELQNSGMTLEAWLEEEGKDETDHDAELVTGAKDAVKAQLVLDAIADRDEVGVSQEELTEQVVRRAQRLQISPDEYAQQIVANNQVGALVAEVRRGKALASVLEAATITDASGQTVDLSRLGPDGSINPEVETTEVDAADVISAVAEAAASAEAASATDADGSPAADLSPASAEPDESATS